MFGDFLSTVAQRLQFGRRPRLCDPEVATANSSLELTVGSSSEGKPTRGRRGDTVACIYPLDIGTIYVTVPHDRCASVSGP